MNTCVFWKGDCTGWIRGQVWRQRPLQEYYNSLGVKGCGLDHQGKMKTTSRIKTYLRVESAELGGSSDKGSGDETGEKVRGVGV